MGENENFAEKMKKLRAKKRISIEDLANKAGYSKKLLTQIENNEILAPVSVILSISQALSVATEEVLLSEKEQASPKSRSKQRKDTLQKRSENYSYEVLTTEGKNKHLNAFLVTIEPQQDHKMVAYHHPGEEFVYVLSGSLELKVGRNGYHLHPGEYQHFDSSKAHKLKSSSDVPTVILVTIYTP
ncbi:MAG: hypothetical protein AUK24_03330 [Syntrophaceae bacterium CG2_30_49_12]|nr:MAG: hypothetical protein AUK24_03330 [Syntrophaceae bacterium CG2_30_49_12]PIP08485.1 MAG: XRE family transcriptional regulator [Syntrophobacterales bacterium CG23_combo_of_CG06-09_8_20_14_all_48_27]PJA49812.1 MAG: XRE family transcriptional regulator [Syntrophobacterales bacterium CG_4_9_14_3_um_filter_49_8]